MQVNKMNHGTMAPNQTKNVLFSLEPSIDLLKGKLHTVFQHSLTDQSIKRIDQTCCSVVRTIASAWFASLLAQNTNHLGAVSIYESYLSSAVSQLDSVSLLTANQRLHPEIVLGFVHEAETLFILDICNAIPDIDSAKVRIMGYSFHGSKSVIVNMYL